MDNDDIIHTEVPKPVGLLLELSNAVDSLQNHLSLRRTERDVQVPRIRHKRETVDHIGAVIEEIQESLGQLEKTFLEPGDAKQGNSTTHIEHRRDGAKCFLENNGKVNCSNIIYEDENSWRKSRLQIDMMIRVLKNKIVNLKNIKRHLKDHRPHTIGDYEDSGEDDILNATTSEPSQPISQKPAHLHHHHRHHQKHNNMHPENTNSEWVGRRRKTGNHSSVDTGQTSIAKSDKNELIDNQITQLVLPDNATGLLLPSTSATPSTNRRPNRTHSLNHGRRTHYDEMAAFRAEHQAMFSTTNLPQLNAEISPVEVDASTRAKPNRSKSTRKPTTTEATDLDHSSTTTVEPLTNVAISNELSSMFSTYKKSGFS